MKRLDQGRTRAALEFYHEALGGELTLLAMKQDGTLQEATADEAIMHGALTSDGLLIMGSDGSPDYPVSDGDNISIALSGSDRERLTAAFAKLSAGGEVKQQLTRESWGDEFGHFVDKFGINWMVNISASDNQ